MEADADDMRMIIETQNMEKVQLRMRIAELEASWLEIDVALANAERSAIDRAEETPRLFYSRRCCRSSLAGGHYERC